jgi:hypothetical protein
LKNPPRPRVLPALSLVAAVLLPACGGERPGPATSSAATPPPPPAAAAPPSSTAGPSGTGAAGHPLPVPVAVIVENAPDARPQSGLDRADVVWEILAEGFITRFFAIYASQPSPKIGPVRSTRIYFDQLDRAYGVPLAHAGGNADALAEIPAWHLQDLDEIYGAGAYFWRSPDRSAPHNLYTSTDLLEKAVAARGYRAPALRLPPAGPLPAGAQPTSEVVLTYYDDPKVYTYIAGWRWQGGAWVRTVNGQVQAMADGATVRAGTVFVLVVPQAPDTSDPANPGALSMLWERGGQAWVLRDGQRAEGTWALGSDGLPAVRVGGAAAVAGSPPYWYEVVPTAADVRFA